MSNKSNRLTDAEITLLQEFLDAIEELNTRKPKPLSSAAWKKALEQVKETGEIPTKYRDRIGVTQVKDKKTGKTQRAYYDVAEEQWFAENKKAEEQYHDAIVKALRYALAKDSEQTQEQTIIELLQQLISENKELPAIIAHKLKEIDFPVDKLNRDIWGLLKYSTDGQITFAKYDVSKHGSKDPIDILFSLDFSNLKNVSITRKLEPYDKRVYIAIGAKFNQGNPVMSIQQIYNSMGYKGRAGAIDIKKINDSITKMNGAHLFIDNIAEANAYNYERFKYDSSLLPMERVQAIVKGQTAEAAIHVFREPPMLSFARERKQITTVDIKLLDSPLSKTNANIQLEDYLIEEIARIKKGSRNNKMLYKTIYENTDIKTVKQRQRAPGKIMQLLEHYKNCGYIKSYTDAKDGVLIEY